MSEFDFQIIYRKGKEHGNADGMSRKEREKDDENTRQIICVIMTRAKKREMEEIDENEARRINDEQPKKAQNIQRTRTMGLRRGLQTLQCRTCHNYDRRSFELE